MRYTSRIVVALAVAAIAVSACDDDSLVVPTGHRANVCPDARPLVPPGCTDFTQFVRTAGLLNTDGESSGIAANGGFVYVADGDNGLLVLEACDPARVAVASRVTVGASAQDVDVVGNLAYVAAGPAGLVVVDVANPRLPRILGKAAGAGGSCDVNVDARSKRAYVADDAVGLMIYDVSDPENPLVLGVENTAGQARGVCVEGALAFVADAQLGLRIASVESPQDPWLVRAVATPGDSYDVAVRDGFAYVADGIAGLAVVDVRSPAEAEVVGQVDTGDRATDVAIDGNIAYVVDRGDGLLLFDVSVPATPQLITRSSGEGVASAVTLDRDYAYIADGRAGVRIVDVREPAPVPVLARSSPPGGVAHALLAVDGTVFVADDVVGMYATHWSGSGFVLWGDTPLGGPAERLTYYEGFVYACAGAAGVQIVDVSDLTDPEVVGALPGTSGATDIAFGDSVAITVRGGLSRPTMFDLRTGAGPAALEISGGVVRAVAAGAAFAYLVQIQGKLFTSSLDIDSQRLVLWTQLTRGNSTDVQVRGDIFTGEQLFVANARGFTDPDTGIDTSAGVEVYDLSNPLIPEFITYIETSIPAERIAFDGDLMLVAGDADGLEVFDVSDPFSPVPLGSYWRNAPINDAVASNGVIILAGDAAGLLAIPGRCAQP